MKELREILINYVIERVPRILGMQDIDPTSKTYGSFDRPYWHYKMKPFESNVVNANCYVLALLYNNKFKGNKYYKNENILERAIAGSLRILNNINKHGALSEYWTNDNDHGATVFATIAMLETFKICRITATTKMKKIKEFIKDHKEIGFIGNHRAATEYLKTMMKEETKDYTKHLEYGFLPERDTIDPGYNTFTLNYFNKIKGTNKETIKKMIKFTKQEISGNCTFTGGRNNSHFYPLPFIQNIEQQESRIILAIFKNALKDRTLEYMDDDYYMYYNMHNYLESIIKIRGKVKKIKLQIVPTWKKHNKSRERPSPTKQLNYWEYMILNGIGEINWLWLSDLTRKWITKNHMNQSRIHVPTSKYLNSTINEEIQ